MTGRLLFVSFLLFLLLLSTRILGSADLGWHIRAGERIVTERAIPTTDTFSYTAGGKTWWVNQWLAEVLFYEVDRAAGGAGLILFRLVTTALIFLVLHRSGRLAGGGSTLVGAAVLVIALLASSSHLLVRPFLISVLFLAGTGWIVERARRGRGGALPLLPLLYAVWAHVHPGFLYGFGLLGCTLLGEELRARVRFLRGGLPSRTGGERRRLWLWSAAALLAAILSGALINPHGVRAILLPVGLLKTGFFFDVLGEFQRAHWWRDRFFVLLLLVAVFSLTRRERRWDATEVLSLLLFGFFAFRAVRVILPFAAVAAPIAIRNLSPPVSVWEMRRPRAASLARLGAFMGVLLLSVWWWREDPWTLTAWWKLDNVPKEDRLWDPSNHPLGTYRFIDGESLPGRVFHHDRWGGSFIRYFYPRRQNFIDGRVEVYGEEFWKSQYFRILGCGPGWEGILEDYGVNLLMLRIGPKENTEPIRSVVSRDPEWALVHLNDQLALYVRRSAVDAGLLRRWELSGLSPGLAPAPRSYEEEQALRSGLERVLRWEVSQRARLVQARLRLLRDDWEAVARIEENPYLVRRGNPLLREALYRLRGEARFRLGDLAGARRDWEEAKGDEEARADRRLLRFLDGAEPGTLVEGAADPTGELTRLGLLLFEAERHDHAARLFREAVRRDGGSTPSRNALAWILLEGGEGGEEALEVAREAARQAPEDGYVRGTLGRALLEVRGDREGAGREYAEAIRLLPEEDYRTLAATMGRWALLLSEGGDPREAARLAGEALRLDPETEEREALSRVLATP